MGIGGGLLKSIIRRSVVADYSAVVLHVALICSIVMIYITFQNRLSVPNVQAIADDQYGQGAAILQDALGFLVDIPANLQEVPDFLRDEFGIQLETLLPQFEIPVWLIVAVIVIGLIILVLPFVLLIPSNTLVTPEQLKRRSPVWKEVCEKCGTVKVPDGQGGIFCPRHDAARFVDAVLVFQVPTDLDRYPEIPDDAHNLLTSPIRMSFHPARSEVTIGKGAKDDARIPTWLHPALSRVQEHHAEIHYEPRLRQLTLHTRVQSTLEDLKLNGQTIVGGQAFVLENEDVVTMGDAAFLFSYTVVPEE